MAKLAQVATARQAQLQDGRRLGFAELAIARARPLSSFTIYLAIASCAIPTIRSCSAWASV